MLIKSASKNIHFGDEVAAAFESCSTPLQLSKLQKQTSFRISVSGMTVGSKQPLINTDLSASFAQSRLISAPKYFVTPEGMVHRVSQYSISWLHSNKYSSFTIPKTQSRACVDGPILMHFTHFNPEN